MIPQSRDFEKALVKVRIKNKGSQAHQKGPKRPKYQAPPEHPDTPQDLADTAIHANHMAGFNAGLRRKLAGYRRRPTTYAKQEETLQTCLDVHWVLHNFVRPHFNQAGASGHPRHPGERLLHV